MSNITVYHPKTGKQVPVYYPTPNTQPKPNLASGKVLSALMLMLMLATPIVAIMHQSQQQLLITQPSISAISENLKK